MNPVEQLMEDLRVFREDSITVTGHAPTKVPMDSIEVNSIDSFWGQPWKPQVGRRYMDMDIEIVTNGAEARHQIQTNDYECHNQD